KLSVIRPPCQNDALATYTAPSLFCALSLHDALPIWFGVAHCEFQLYQETGSEERLPGVRGTPSLRSPWSNLRSSSACARSTGGPKGGPPRSRWRSAFGSCSAPT